MITNIEYEYLKKGYVKYIRIYYQPHQWLEFVLGTDLQIHVIIKDNKFNLWPYDFSLTWSWPFTLLVLYL